MRPVHTRCREQHVFEPIAAHRAGDEAAMRALLRSIAGVVGTLRNTG